MVSSGEGGEELRGVKRSGENDMKDGDHGRE